MRRPSTSKRSAPGRQHPVGLGRALRPVVGVAALLLSTLVAVPAWSLTALLSFSLELPFYSTVKAFFLLSLAPILAVQLARGRALVGAGSRPVRIAGDCVLVALAIINVALFRYPAQ